MHTYTLAELRNACIVAGVTSGATLFVHSSLMHLGRLQGESARAVPGQAFRVLKELLGEQGTLVVPAFTFAFCRGSPFDLRSSPAENMGALSEYVRLLPEARRSSHPMQSVAAVGPRAKEICSPDTAGSFDDEGPFDTLLALDARVLLLGASFQALSFIHYAEQRANVPYRLWKSFSGLWRDDGPPEERTYRMFVRDLEVNPKLRLAPLEASLRAQSLLATSKLGGGQVVAFAARDAVTQATEALRRDPFVFVEKEPHE